MRRAVVALTWAIIALNMPSPAFADEDCLGCHDGSVPDAPNVADYWDGSLWDSTMPGTDDVNQGGHGDPDNLSALTCEGVSGCHDLSGAENHQNGILETAGTPSLNTAHLRDFFISPSDSPPSAVAETFNTACATACHLDAAVSICGGPGHAVDSGVPYSPLFGTTVDIPPDGDGSDGPRRTGLWLDSDLSTRASLADPDYALCVSCHNPHGTGIDDGNGDHPVRSNFMIRGYYSKAGDPYLCFSCHGTEAPVPAPPFVDAGDGTFADRIDLTWPDVDGETGYRIYRSLLFEGPYTLIATKGADQTSFTDPNRCGGLYYYVVRAHRGGMNSDPTIPDIGSTSVAATAGIGGTVRSLGGSGVANVRVVVFDGGFNPVAEAVTSAGGSYGVCSLPGGSYKVLFRGEAAQHVSRWYDGRYGFEDAPSVSVADLTVTPGVDVSLMRDGDWNGDGRADIFWRNYQSGDNRVWHMAGSSRLGELALPQMADTSWFVGAVSDLNGDARPDILWRHGVSGRNLIWFTDGTGILATGELRRVSAQTWQIAGLADSDGDGKTDILWHNSATGQNIFSLLDGLRITALVILPSLEPPWAPAGLADFDGDGGADIVWRHGTTGENLLWYLQGNSLLGTSPVKQVPDLNWSPYQLSDFDNDGRADMVWRHALSGKAVVARFSDSTLLGTNWIPTESDPAWKIEE